MTDNAGTTLMRPDQAAVFAQGLYHLANVDGIHEHERQLIGEFLDEVGQPDLMDELDKGEFDAMTAAAVLETSFLRRIFLQTAVVLVRAEGVFSEGEDEALRSVAFAFQMDDALDELLEETRDMRID